MLSWVLLSVAPRWRHTNKLVKASTLFSAAVYLFNLGMSAAVGLPEGAGFSSLAEVMAIFNGAHVHLAQACWVHYICFDLLIGQQIAKRAQEEEVPHLLVVPCLFSTLMAGPVGYGMFELILFVRKNIMGITKPKSD